MKILSWNINGWRSTLKHGFWDWLAKSDADIICLQECKINNGQLAEIMSDQKVISFTDLAPGPARDLFSANTPAKNDASSDAKNASKPRHEYFYFLHDAAKPGYSGVCTLSRKKPKNIITGLGDARYDAEGRTLVFEYDDFTLFNCYFPNAQRDLARMDIKQAYNEKFLGTLEIRRAKKENIISCGDFNVAHTEMDIKNAASNRGNSGFTDEERAFFGKLLKTGYTDTFRHFYPSEKDRYTWWSNRPGVRARNIGWRIDYFVVNNEFLPRVASAAIHENVMGSDHCPVEIVIS